MALGGGAGGGDVTLVRAIVRKAEPENVFCHCHCFLP